MLTVAKSIKQTLIATTALFAFCVLAVSVLSVPVSAVTKPPIPAGCPGSIKTGTDSNTPECDKEPAGCPGSTKGSTPDDPAKFNEASCKFQANCLSSSGSSNPNYSDSTKTYCDCDPTVTTVSEANDRGCKLTGSLDCQNVGTDKQTCNSAACTKDNCDLVDKYLNPAFNFVSSIVGLIVVLSIILGGVQYASAGPDPQKVTKAKNRIVKSVIALVMYFFVYSFIQYFLIPGGLF